MQLARETLSVHVKGRMDVNLVIALEHTAAPILQGVRLLRLQGVRVLADGSSDTITLVMMLVRIWPHATPLAMAISFVHAVDVLAVILAIVHITIAARFPHTTGESSWSAMTIHAGPLAQI
jgi:hypothetical protein